MDFYDRKIEMEALKAIREESKERSRFTVLIGRRRIGKTALLMEALKKCKYLYLFVSRTNEGVLSERFQQDAFNALGLKIYGTMSSFRDFFEQLLIFAQTTNFTLVIDEFQDFKIVNPAIFSDIQNLWDQYREKTKINFIVCGSIYSLMTNIFENNKEALFGRMTSKIKLEAFTPGVIKKILSDYNKKWKPEDLLCLYCITGGVPKYISLLMDAGACTKNKMIAYITRRDSPFLYEGKDMLVSEFGKDYAIYFSIMQLIAHGKTLQNEIDLIVGKTTGAYLANLEKEYSLIVRNKPIFSRPESRNTRWKIDDHFLKLFFRFFYPNQFLIETGKLDILQDIILKDYEQYTGLVLESYFKNKIVEEEKITAIGNYWDKKGANEIDIIALNDIDKTAIIAEVKRNKKKISLEKLAIKKEVIAKELLPYKITLKALSMEDM